MLIGASLEFERVCESHQAEEIEGVIVEDNERFTCLADGELFIVKFKSFTNNQILRISPSWDNNLDPDGGTTFMCREVVSLANALTSESKYL